MAEVHQGTVVYGSAWEVTGGDIQLSIEKVIWSLQRDGYDSLSRFAKC